VILVGGVAVYFCRRIARSCLR